MRCEGGRDAAVDISTSQRQITMELSVCDLKDRCISETHGEGSQPSGGTYRLVCCWFSGCFQVFFYYHEVFLVGQVLCWETGAMCIINEY